MVIWNDIMYFRLSRWRWWSTATRRTAACCCWSHPWIRRRRARRARSWPCSSCSPSAPSPAPRAAGTGLWPAPPSSWSTTTLAPAPPPSPAPSLPLPCSPSGPENWDRLIENLRAWRSCRCLCCYGGQEVVGSCLLIWGRSWAAVCLEKEAGAVAALE